MHFTSNLSFENTIYILYKLTLTHLEWKHKLCSFSTTQIWSGQSRTCCGWEAAVSEVHAEWFLSDSASIDRMREKPSHV